MLEFLFLIALNLFNLVIQGIFELVIICEFSITMGLFYYFSELLNNDDLLQIANHLSNDYFIFLENTNFNSIVNQYYWRLPYAFFDSNISSFSLLGYDSNITVIIIYVTQNLIFSLFILYIMILLYYFWNVTNLNSGFQIFEFFITWISIIVTYDYVFLILKFNLYLGTLIPVHIYDGLFILFILFLIIWFSIVFFFILLFFTINGYNLSLFRTYMNFVFFINLVFIVLCIINFYVSFNSYVLIFTIFVIFFFINSFYDFINFLNN